MTMKQKTSHKNKDAKKVAPVKLPKNIKPTKGQSSESKGGGPRMKKGKSL